jgi:hypothetical protein
MSRIQLKNIKYASFASQETLCYEASVYFDGKRVGHVANDGHGGCDYQDPSDKDGWAKMIDYIDLLNELKTIEERGAAMKRYCRQLNEWGDASYWEFQQSDALFYEQYKDDPHGGGDTLLDSALRHNNEDLESICFDLLNDYLTRRDLKRLLSKRVVYRNMNGTVLQTNIARNKATLQAWIQQVTTTH